MEDRSFVRPARRGSEGTGKGPLWNDVLEAWRQKREEGGARAEATPRRTGSRRTGKRGDEGAGTHIQDGGGTVPTLQNGPEPHREAPPRDRHAHDELVSLYETGDALSDIRRGTGPLSGVLISEETRERIRAALGDPREEHVRFALHTLLSRDVHVDHDRAGRAYERVKAGRGQVEEAAGGQGALRRGYGSAKAFLDEYCRLVPGLELTEYYAGSHPRLVRSHGLPDDVVEAVLDDLSQAPSSLQAPVIAWDGAKRSEATAARYELCRRRSTVEAIADMYVRDPRLAADATPAPNVVRMMSGAPTNTLAALVSANASAAIDVARGRSVDPLRMARDLAAVQSALIAPAAVYGPSRRLRSPRVFPVTSGVVTLPSSVRRTVMAGCLEADLRAAQLAIIGRELDVAEVLRLLDGAGSPWDHLLAACGIAAEGRLGAKPAVKEAVYAAVFGMSEDGIRWMVTRKLGRRAADGLLAAPVVRALLDARDRELARIAEDGGTEDCYGVWRSATDEEGAVTPAGARSALACRAQARELWLLEPVVDDALAEAAKRQPLYVPAAWQHDGLTVKVKRGVHNDRVERRLRALVERRAAELSIPTYLETEWL